MKKFPVLLTLVLRSLLGQAQYTDFTGVWIFRDQESISGNLLDNGSPSQIKAMQKKDAISIEKLTDGGNVNTLTNETVSFNGKPFEMIAPTGRKKSMTIKWSADRKSFAETTSIFSVADSSRIDYRVTDTWLMEGGRLIFIRKDENLLMGEVWESKAYYDRQ